LKRVRWRAVIDRTATARIQRLIRWLEPFQRCFGHRAQRLALIRRPDEHRPRRGR
jgi:hypothetical protein